MKPVFVLGLLALLLAQGCRRPDAYRPDFYIPAAPRWAAGVQIPGAVSGEWWETLQSPELNALVREALEQNRTVELAAARIEAARAEAVVVGAPLRPQVQANLNRVRQRQVFVGLPIPAAEGDVLRTTFTQVSGLLEFSWEPDFWGRLRAGELAAASDVEAFEAELEAAKQSLAAQVTRAWIAVIAAREQVRLAAATAENFRLSAERVRERHRRGLVPSLDLRLSLTNEALAESTLEQTRAQLAQAVRQLETLLGRYPAGTLETEDSLPPFPGPVPAGIPSELIARRPDLLAAERRLLAAGARTAEARTALYPSFALTGALGLSSNRLIDLLQGNFGIWNYATNILLPLLNGGRLRAQGDAAEAQAREAAASFTLAVLEAYAQVEMALAVEEYLRGQDAHLQVAAKQAVAARDLAERQYRAGLEGILTVLESQRQALDAQAQLIGIRREMFDNRIDLHVALVGGTAPAGQPARQPAAQPGMQASPVAMPGQQRPGTVSPGGGRTGPPGALRW